MSQIRGLGDHTLMVRLLLSWVDFGIQGSPLMNIKVHKVSLEIHILEGKCIKVMWDRWL